MTAVAVVMAAINCFARKDDESRVEFRTLCSDAVSMAISGAAQSHFSNKESTNTEVANRVKSYRGSTGKQPRSHLRHSSS